MQKTLKNSLNRISKNGLEHYLGQLQRGIEKESLRVNPEGRLAQTPHPKSLGSPLTHSSITTDYSEALLEFVTPIHTDIGALLDELTDIHHYTYLNIGDEKLWVNSMPCVVDGEERIPIARYGNSNIAKMKEAYRRGLGHRYGRLMQTIAGIHYNFSLKDEFWVEYLDVTNDTELVTEKSASYIDLTRNFLRHSWLVCYLFGASPAVCKTFLKGRHHTLENHDPGSFYSHDATSLRLSGLGYSNDSQSGINISYNNLSEYANTLRTAIQTPHPAYQKIPLLRNGKYQQLSPNLLQIENEFYGVIRPKVVARSGESPARALLERGVEYVEVRSLDLNPFSPIGIDAECIRFFDIFLIYCLLSESKNMSAGEQQETAENRQRAVMHGRKVGLKLTINQQEIDFQDAANTLLDNLRDIAFVLDQVSGGDEYMKSLNNQRDKVKDPSLTPSARILAEMDQGFESFFHFSLYKAKQHKRYFLEKSLSDNTIHHYQQQAKDSIAKQIAIEDSDNISFNNFLKQYFERQNAI